MRSDYLRGHVDALLLAVLRKQSGHGYALSQRLAELSDGELLLPEGSLYPALTRLENRGLVTSSWDTASGRRRRTYRLTRAGRREVTVAARDWSVFSTAIDRVLGDQS